MENRENHQLVLSKPRAWLYQKCVDKARRILGNREKVGKTLRKARKIVEKFRFIPKFKELSRHICDFCDLLADYFEGLYPNLPMSTIVALLAGLLYLVLPFDVIADFFPAVGWVDDAAVLAFVMAAEQNDVKEYKAWKKKQRFGDNAIIDSENGADAEAAHEEAL